MSRRSLAASVRAGFVTFEGIDGSGKSTVSRLVADMLKERGERVVLTAEPTATWLGDAVRRSYQDDVGALAEAFLFLADRAHHVPEIRKHIEAGRIVLCDRYADSTYAYQGARLEGIVQDPIGFLRRISEPWLVSPDVTILLRVPPELGLKRLDDRAIKVRFEDLGFLKRVAANYERLAKEKRFVALDGSRSARDVARDAVAAIERSLESPPSSRKS